MDEKKYDLRIGKESNERILEMEENGTIDYYLEFKKYIGEFLNNNYPLSQEDLRSILQNNPTENVINRQETSRILNEAMTQVLEEIAEENIQMLNGDFSHINESFQYRFSEKQQKMLQILWEKQRQEEQGITGEKIETSVGGNELAAGEELQLETEIQEEQDVSESELYEEDVSINEGTTNDNSQNVYTVQDNSQLEETIDIEAGMETDDTQGGQQLLDEVVKQSQKINVRNEEIKNENIAIRQAEIDYTNSKQKQTDIGRN